MAYEPYETHKKINHFKKDRNEVVCEWHSSERRDFYVDEDMKVLPCCFYVGGMKRTPDPVFEKFTENNPDWNDLSKHTMEEIANTEMYQKHFWLFENPSEICIRNCGWKYQTPDDFEKSPDNPEAND